MSFRDRLDVEALLQSLDIKYERYRDNLTARCPNPEHTDSKPSWTIVDAPGAKKHAGHKCWGCGFRGGPWELVSAARGLDEEAAAEFVTAFILGKPRASLKVPTVRVRMPRTAAREYELPTGVHIPSVDGSEWPAPFAQYLTARSVTSEQLERWHIGWATRGKLAWRIVVPIHTRGRLVAHVARAIFDDRVRYDMPTKAMGAQPSTALFGEPLIDPSLGVLTIAEGVFSALALERANAANPIALLGSDWSVAKAAILTSHAWSRVLIATDPDEAGERVARSISASFRRTKVSRVKLGQSPDDSEPSELRARLAAALTE